MGRGKYGMSLPYGEKLRQNITMAKLERAGHCTWLQHELTRFIEGVSLLMHAGVELEGAESMYFVHTGNYTEV